MTNVADDIRRLIMDVPDFPKPGIVFKDITPVFLSPKVSKALTVELAERYAGKKVDLIAAIESRGFLVGAPLAQELGLPLVLVRKPGKLPRATHRRSYALEYGTDTLEMHKDAVHHGARVVLVDDLLATGGTATAVAGLLGDAGAVVVEAAFIIELGFLGGRSRLSPVGCHAVVQY